MAKARDNCRTLVLRHGRSWAGRRLLAGSQGLRKAHQGGPPTVAPPCRDGVMGPSLGEEDGQGWLRAVLLVPRWCSVASDGCQEAQFPQSFQIQCWNRLDHPVQEKETDINPKKKCSRALVILTDVHTQKNNLGPSDGCIASFTFSAG